MYQAVIIADDFSSVTDCGVQFSQKGLSTTALLDLPDNFPISEVLSINTDSRPMSSQQAYTKVFAAACNIKKSGCRRIYKSIDSTLRGNLGAEIDAIMDAFVFSTALVAPAFPLYGRTTVNGIHYLNGKVLSESSVARDPISPMYESDLSKILCQQSKRKVTRIPLEQLRNDMLNLLEDIKTLIAQGSELIIFDVETEDDLKKVAAVSFRLPEALVVGSTGLAQYMADGWGISVPDRVSAFPGENAPVVFVAASASPVTAAQVASLIKEPGIFSICFNAWDITANENDVYANSIIEALKRNEDVVLYLDTTTEGRARSEQEAELHGIERMQLSQMIVSAMAKLTKIAVSTGIPRSVLMTGGDTAKAVCLALGSCGMELLDEVEPGIPAGRLMDERRMLAAIKAGAFGSSKALCKTRKLLRGEQ